MFTYGQAPVGGDPVSQLRNQVLDTIGDNALALRQPPSGSPDAGALDLPGPSSIPAGDDDASFQVALRPWEKRVVMSGLQASGADKGFDRTIGALTSGAFAPQEIKDLENRVLDKAQWGDVMALRGVQEGVPVRVTPKQKSVIDGLMGQLGDDPLAHRARDAYGNALKAGDVRVR